MNKMIFALSMVAAALTGCSAISKGPALHAGSLGREMRGAAPIHPKRARALLSGPALVEHLDTEGDGAVTLYLTDDPGIGDRACPSAFAEDSPAVAVLQRQSRLTDINVPTGKRICASVSDAHTMTVSWHARSAADPPNAAFDLALQAALDGIR
jgi:hypothetical protein